ncbi:oligosaccharide flippase family protein [Patescibacteria group bacterium]|nr:oligosaccharide flippase family protein [Patescibacteria group bacterium]MCG2701948.1 oligosaccharide flippase family protein [Candidatus Parcubacteria bacterium]MBU4265157.1 oligosaccharide flippase family protein [Patescibacteria group bacterium]MBU4390721.1 oligosaccharide flippase family protein [Patescibacteria group bacterium]MBU4397480.1 oligosaccharide flippase family protein [Patescibacteria group bacterium]
MSTDLQQIKQKSIKSVIFLSARNFSIQAISSIGFFILTILLGTADVGLFGIVAETVAILGYFSDLGFVSALIQQKKEVTKKQLQTAFTTQQLLVILSILLVALTYPKIKIARNYGPKETWILISLVFSFFTASLKTIPSVLLERKLEFKKISSVDIVENIFFYFLAVLLASMGFGAYSYAYAIFAKSIVGLILIYKISPWPIGISFNWESAKKLFKFGIPYQINSLIAVAKDRLSNLLVAGIIGRNNFAFLTWGQKAPRVSLSIMDAVTRISFPAFSRLQKDKESLKKILQKSTYFIALVAFPMLVGTALIAKNIMFIVPKYTKWLPALVPLYVFCFNFAIAAITTPLTNAFNAVGKITVTTRLMIMWTVLTWIFYPILSLKFGLYGTLLASIIVNLSSFYVWHLIKKHFSANIFTAILHPLLASLIMLSALLLISQLPISHFSQLISKILIGTLIYVGYHLIFSKQQLLWFFHQLKSIKKTN